MVSQTFLFIELLASALESEPIRLLVITELQRPGELVQWIAHYRERFAVAVVQWSIHLARLRFACPSDLALSPVAKSVWRRLRATPFFRLQEVEFIPRKMNISSLQNNFGTEALLQACANFDPSDASHKVVMRLMVVPMLQRRLGLLHIAARVAPTSKPIQSAIREFEVALSTAAARLDRTACQGSETGRKKQTRG